MVFDNKATFPTVTINTKRFRDLALTNPDEDFVTETLVKIIEAEEPVRIVNSWGYSGKDIGQLKPEHVLLLMELREFLMTVKTPQQKIKFDINARSIYMEAFTEDYVHAITSTDISENAEDIIILDNIDTKELVIMLIDKLVENISSNRPTWYSSRSRELLLKLLNPDKRIFDWDRLGREYFSDDFFKGYLDNELESYEMSGNTLPFFLDLDEVRSKGADSLDDIIADIRARIEDYDDETISEADRENGEDFIDWFSRVYDDCMHYQYGEDSILDYFYDVSQGGDYIELLEDNIGLDSDTLNKYIDYDRIISYYGEELFQEYFVDLELENKYIDFQDPRIGNVEYWGDYQFGRETFIAFVITFAEDIED